MAAQLLPSVEHGQLRLVGQRPTLCPNSTSNLTEASSAADAEAYMSRCQAHLRQCCSTVQSTISLAASETTSQALQQSVGLWIAVLDAVTEMVVPKHVNTQVLSTPKADRDVAGNDDAVISDLGKAIEMVDIRGSERLQPRLLVVMLSEALLAAAVRVAGAAKQREGLNADEGIGSVSKHVRKFPYHSAHLASHCNLFTQYYSIHEALCSVEALSAWMERCWHRYEHM